jgi:hypothetical protein
MRTLRAKSFACPNMYTFITLPGSFTTDIASTTSDTLSSFSPYIVLILGVLLAGVVLEMILGAVRHR